MQCDFFIFGSIADLSAVQHRQLHETLLTYRRLIDLCEKIVNAWTPNENSFVRKTLFKMASKKINIVSQTPES